MKWLKMAMIETIQSLHLRGCANRRIAKELGVDRDTVSRHIRQIQAKAKTAKVITGSEAEAKDANAAKVITGSDAWLGTGQAVDPALDESARSMCEPWRAVIVAKLELGLTAQRIYQDLVSDHRFTGPYNSVRRFIVHLGRSRALPFRRMECAAGVEAQVDFHSGKPIRRMWSLNASVSIY